MAKKLIYKINPEFPDYAIYEDGTIQSLQKQRYHFLARRLVDNFRYLQFVKIRKHPQWHLKFCGLKNKHGITTTVFIHKIVAETYLRKKKNCSHVWFKDDNKDNTHFSNLFFCHQGDLNHIQVRLGTRDMVKQAAIMRKNAVYKKSRGRVPGGKMINNKYVK